MNDRSDRCACACSRRCLACGQAVGWSSGEPRRRQHAATATARPATRTAGAAASQHAAGEGTEHTNAYGGSTAHAYGGGTEHTNVYGGSTYGKYGERGVSHVPRRGDGLPPAGLSGVSDLSGVPPAGRGALLLDRLLRLRGGRGCGRRHGGGRGGRLGEHGGRHLERVQRGRGGGQRHHGGRHRRGVQCRRCGRCDGRLGRRHRRGPGSGTWVMGMSYATLPARLDVDQQERRRRIT